MTGFFIVMAVLGTLVAYLGVGAKYGREFYIEGHRKWFDEKIRERYKWLAKTRRSETAEDTLAVLRKRWEKDKNGQGEVLVLALFVVLSWPIAVPVFRLARDPRPEGEEAKLVNAALEAEVERLRRQVEGGS